MVRQILAIAWAQFRISRNHLPRTSLGTILTWFMLLLWYALYASLAVFLALKIPETPLGEVRKWFAPGLLGIFLFWQIIPLFTLSSGWSLELNKLQIYPIKRGSLFAIETVLRLTSAPEMIILLAGVAAGLFRNPSVPLFSPIFLLLFVPINLFLQQGLRDLILHSFERNRFRELFALVFVSIAIVPQLLLRTGLGHTAKPYFFAAARIRATPWHAVASLSLGQFYPRDLAVVLFWTALAFGFAYWMFVKSMGADDSFRTLAANAYVEKTNRKFRVSSLPGQIFSDPLGVLIQKELQSLIRMPRFRVLFGMACILGIVVFVPAALNGHDPAAHFMRNNLIPVVNVYGLLLLSDALLLNAFGLDRGAAQLYFVSPVSLRTVLKAKNLAAVVFVALQSAIILAVAAMARAPITWPSVASGLLASAVVTIFLLTTGNFTSFAMARPIDPKQTFKKQAGAKMQIWLLGCTAALFLLIGFAFLAAYGLQRGWVFSGVLGFEFLVGLVCYRIGLESAVARGLKNREKIVQTLSHSGSPVSLG